MFKSYKSLLVTATVTCERVYGSDCVTVTVRLCDSDCVAVTCERDCDCVTV